MTGVGTFHDRDKCDISMPPARAEMKPISNFKKSIPDGNSFSRSSREGTYVSR
jgi:hypothetical protein